MDTENIVHLYNFKKVIVGYVDPKTVIAELERRISYIRVFHKRKEKEELLYYKIKHNLQSYREAREILKKELKVDIGVETEELIRKETSKYRIALNQFKVSEEKHQPVHLDFLRRYQVRFNKEKESLKRQTGVYIDEKYTTDIVCKTEIIDNFKQLIENNRSYLKDIINRVVVDAIEELENRNKKWYNIFKVEATEENAIKYLGEEFQIYKEMKEKEFQIQIDAYENIIIAINKTGEISESDYRSVLDQPPRFHNYQTFLKNYRG